jgi:hypothetical protein
VEMVSSKAHSTGWAKLATIVVLGLVLPIP